MFKRKKREKIQEDIVTEMIEFNTEIAQEYLEKLEDPEDIVQYLQSEKYFKTFSEQLHYLIEQKKKDRKELNEKLGRVNLNNWLNGKVIPNRKNLIKICFALNCNQAECDTLIKKFAGEQELNADDLDDAVILFCLFQDIPYEDIPQYIEAKDQFVKDRHALDHSNLAHIDDFIRYFSIKVKNAQSNTEKKSQVLKEMIYHPKIQFSKYEENESMIRPLAVFIYGENNEKKAIDRLQKMLSGKLPIKRDEFIKIAIACGYCGLEAVYEDSNVDVHACIDEINEQLEKAGFYKLYARNKVDCIYISAGIQTILNEEPSLIDYLKELSLLFKEYDKEEYAIYDTEDMK